MFRLPLPLSLPSSKASRIKFFGNYFHHREGGKGGSERDYLLPDFSMRRKGRNPQFPRILSTSGSFPQSSENVIRIRGKGEGGPPSSSPVHFPLSFFAPTQDGFWFSSPLLSVNTDPARAAPAKKNFLPFTFAGELVFLPLFRKIWEISLSLPQSAQSSLGREFRACAVAPLQFLPPTTLPVGGIFLSFSPIITSLGIPLFFLLFVLVHTASKEL